MKITRRQIRMLIEAEIFDFEKEKRKRRTPEDREKEDMELAQSAVSGDSEDDWVYDVEGEIELLMRGIESGKVVDLADSDPFDDDPMTEQKTDGEMYGDPSGMGIPLGDDIYEDDSADSKRNRDDDLQIKLAQDTAKANSSSGPNANAARQALRGDQQALSNQDDGIDF